MKRHTVVYMAPTQCLNRYGAKRGKGNKYSTDLLSHVTRTLPVHVLYTVMYFV
jgi:hypothetical protein